MKRNIKITVALATTLLMTSSAIAGAQERSRGRHTARPTAEVAAHLAAERRADRLAAAGFTAERMPRDRQAEIVDALTIRAEVTRMGKMLTAKMVELAALMCVRLDLSGIIKRGGHIPQGIAGCRALLAESKEYVKDGERQLQPLIEKLASIEQRIYHWIPRLQTLLSGAVK